MLKLPSIFKPVELLIGTRNNPSTPTPLPTFPVLSGFPENCVVLFRPPPTFPAISLSRSITSSPPPLYSHRMHFRGFLDF
ncbi:hypothetical protein CEXT_734711 [Caerostris extrusa]|uniref:Uncharacterized protein n=1 Tax=Caerostris extrusa TaxID=172846 RepID=A0AAV4N6R5_CAEEX|nr:hypothetical protein CEXT_734711 [Caerostris extrusa]